MLPSSCMETLNHHHHHHLNSPTMVQPLRSGQHRTRFFTTRVRETLMNRVAMFLCSIFLFILLIAGIVLFVVWLSLRPHRPHFYLTNFAVSGLTPSDGLQSPAFTFDITDRNSNRKIGVHYDAMDGSVYYQNRLIASGPVNFQFYQPPKNTTVVHGEMVGSASITAGDQLWSRFSADLGAGRVEFRLDLNSIIRFELSTWDTHRHRMHVSCLADVGPNGGLLTGSKDSRCSMYFG